MDNITSILRRIADASANSPKSKDAYSEGFLTAQSMQKSGCTVSTPMRDKSCPYPEGTANRELWMRGFNAFHAKW